MSWGDSIHYVLIGNPVSKTVITAASDIAKSTQSHLSSSTEGMSWGDGVHYVFVGNPLSKTAIAAASGIAKSAQSQISSSTEGMSWGDGIHYVFVGNPLSKTAIAAASGIARSAQSHISSSTAGMSWGDGVHYVFVGNPLSKTAIAAISSIARSAGLISSSAAGQSSARSVTTQIMSNTLPLWKLAGANIYFVRLAGLSGASAVILGAYGAHRKYPEDEAELRGVFEVANRYHFFHSIALATMPLVRRPLLTGPLMIIGTLLFAGPCYYRAFTGERKFSRYAPIGGCCLIVAWASMML